MTRLNRTVLRRGGAVVAALAMVVSTSCLPVPEAVIEAACHPVLDSNDPDAWNAVSSTPPGLTEAEWQRARETMNSMRPLAATALWSRIASLSFTSTFDVEVGVVGNVADMTALLEQLAEHPENMVVVDATATVALANQIVATIKADPDLGTLDFSYATPYVVPTVLLDDARTVRVALPLNARSAAYGAQLLSAHPQSVRVVSGGKVVGPDGAGGTDACLNWMPKWVIAKPVPENVSVSIKLDRSTVARGEAVTGAILVTNNNRRSALPVWGTSPAFCQSLGNQPVTTLDSQFVVNQDPAGVEHGLYVVPPGGYEDFDVYPMTGGAVNAVFDETRDPWSECGQTTGFDEVIPPGGTAAVPFRADTFSMQPGADLTLPPGDYYVRPQAFIYAFNLVALPPARFTIR